jgi:hypothetical protein
MRRRSRGRHQPTGQDPLTPRADAVAPTSRYAAQVPPLMITRLTAWSRTATGIPDNGPEIHDLDRSAP